MSDIAQRLRASVGFDTINGNSFERSVCAKQMIEAARTIEKLESQLEQERCRVRVLRGALTMARHDLLGIVPPGSRTIRVMSEALATTAPEGGDV